MDEIKQFFHNVTWKASHKPTLARTKDCVHNLPALLYDVLQVA